ncbi:hypothetical protein ACFFIX_03985 [Metabacillus herbersteinensis]|uniref:Uncharacterized protein n=1 Tax=Metabacillus herbersteinensis TaxID=283816 RepID=A0ABV6GAV4_9BACI
MESEDVHKEILKELRGIREALERIEKESATERETKKSGFFRTILEAGGSLMFGVVVIGPVIVIISMIFFWIGSFFD